MKEFINENKKNLDVLEKYIEALDKKASSLIMILHKAQELFGYLPNEVQSFIADELSIPASKVHGVVTFYSFFHTEKKGKYVISVCLGTACFVRGASEILEQIKTELKINMDETTKDGLFTLSPIRCIGACGLAPVISINGKIYGNVKEKDVKSILDEYRKLG